jgi:hypothetical protein
MKYLKVSSFFWMNPETPALIAFEHKFVLKDHYDNFSFWKIFSRVL